MAAKILSEKDEDVSWASLSNKKQLAILLFARITEPLSQTSFATYMYFQLASFNDNLSDEQIALQAGMITAAFAAGSSATAIWWGRLSQVPWIGRKTCLLAGLSLACTSCIGTGFSTSFLQVLAAQMVGGFASGNLGVIRSAVPEIITDQRYHARAFSLLPMCTTIGTIIGPIWAAFLVGANGEHANLAAQNKDTAFFKGRPFALPMLFNATLVFMAFLTALFFLKEASPSPDAAQSKPPRWARFVSRLYRRSSSIDHRYQPVQHASSESDEDDDLIFTNELEALRRKEGGDFSASDLELNLEGNSRKRFGHLTSKIAWRIASKLLMSMHYTAYATALTIFLPIPLGATANGFNSLTGGLGFSAKQVGTVTTFVAVLGLPIQFLVFPRLHGSFGALGCLKRFVPLSTLAYLGFVFMAVPPEREALRWLCAAALMCLHSTGRTICQPSSLVLINETSDDSNERTKWHSVTHSLDSAASAIGLVLGGVFLRFGIQAHFIGLAWLLIVMISLVNVSVLHLLVV